MVHQGLCWILNNIFKKLFPLFNFSQDFLLDFISETGLLKSLLKTLKPRIALYLLVFLGTNLKSYPCRYNCFWLLSAFSGSDSASPVLLKIYHPLLSYLWVDLVNMCLYKSWFSYFWKGSKLGRNLLFLVNFWEALVFNPESVINSWFGMYNWYDF